MFGDVLHDFLCCQCQYLLIMQEDEGEEEDFTPLSQDNPGGSRRTFSIDSILPHRAVDPRPLRPSRLGNTPSSRLRGNTSTHIDSHVLTNQAWHIGLHCMWMSSGD